ncbi:MAG TPA: response regulator transcription factor [Deltaproteobacteria bacterium]|nr:response regulator transcription factor [Deltaproteobacteria bacterium]
MTNDKPHIMLVEDEIHLARGICFNLEEEGYRISHYESGEKALAALEVEHFDLVILDVMLPGMNGFDACRAIRTMDARVPILMLTACSEDLDRVFGLESGADDYLTKPFNLVEFLLRVKGMLRRSSWYRPEPIEEAYRFGENEVFLLSYRAKTAQGEIDLTEMEVRVLAMFFQKEGGIIPRGELLESVWGYTNDTETRTLDNFIVRLRKYFEPDPGRPVHFQTVRGVGYRFSRKGEAPQRTVAELAEKTGK